MITFKRMEIRTLIFMTKWFCADTNLVIIHGIKYLFRVMPTNRNYGDLTLFLLLEIFDHRQFKKSFLEKPNIGMKWILAFKYQLTNRNDLSETLYFSRQWSLFYVLQFTNSLMDLIVLKKIPHL